MPLPGVLLAPLTLLAGPQASLTVLMTVGFAGSALTMFATARRWQASIAAAGLAGLVYGFSPALIQSSAGHYDLQFAVLPPLIIDAAVRLVTGRAAPAAGPRRGSASGLACWRPPSSSSPRNCCLTRPWPRRSSPSCWPHPGRPRRPAGSATSRPGSAPGSRWPPRSRAIRCGCSSSARSASTAARSRPITTRTTWPASSSRRRPCWRTRPAAPRSRPGSRAVSPSTWAISAGRCSPSSPSSPPAAGVACRRAPPQ